MKCQYCEKPATFHITELTEPSGPQVMHLCEEHAKGFLNKEASPPMIAMMEMKKVVGASWGHVTWRKRAHAPAPSGRTPATSPDRSGAGRAEGRR